jgi:hypothetical protein
VSGDTRPNSNDSSQAGSGDRPGSSSSGGGGGGGGAPFDVSQLTGSQIATHVSATVHRSLNPAFEEEFLVPGASPNSVLVFTLCDENAKGTTLPDFLGQAVLRLDTGAGRGPYASPLREWGSHKFSMKLGPQLVTDVRIDRQRPPLRLASLENDHVMTSSSSDGGGGRGSDDNHLYNTAGSMSLVSAAHAASPWGTLEMTLRMLDRTVSMCGPVNRRVQRVLTTYTWKPAWGVLADGILSFYDSRGDCEPRARIDLAYVLSVDFEEGEHAGDAIVVHVSGEPAAAFQVPPDYDANEKSDATAAERAAVPSAAPERREWLRKLRRAAKLIPTNEFSPAEVPHSHYLAYKGTGAPDHIYERQMSDLRFHHHEGIKPTLTK